MISFVVHPKFELHYPDEMPLVENQKSQLKIPSINFLNYLGILKNY